MILNLLKVNLLKASLDHTRLSVLVPKEIEDEWYVPNELIHHIQSLLPVKDAARTCVLSKSWLNAWYTIPTLRFTTCVSEDNLAQREETNYIIKLIDGTLLRYLNNNMPIESFHLHLDIETLSFPSLVENWFRVLASRNCLKELSLSVCGKKLVKNTNDQVARNTNEVVWLTIPDAVFSTENLNTIRLRADDIGLDELRINTNPVIKCSYLRVLELVDVCISEGALHNLFSSCSLLEKISIIVVSQHVETIKVKNLRYLRELKITLKGDMNKSFEIYDVPSLRLMSYVSLSTFTIRMDTLGSVRKLILSRLTVDVAFFDMLMSKFPYLETLILAMPDCLLETLEFTSVTLKRVTLFCFSGKQMKIKIYASKLLYFSYTALTTPSLLFPSNTPKNIKLILCLYESDPIDLSFFLNLRKALDLSSNFYIEIQENFVPLNIDDLDELRRMVPFPARNVQQLSFGKHHGKELWEQSPLFDFVFSTCYPRYVKVYYRSSKGKNYWYKQMVGIMEKKACDLQDMEIKNPCDGKWKSLKNSWTSYDFLSDQLPSGSDDFLSELPLRSFYDEGNDYSSDKFKLTWLS